jgi:sulfoxide reductase heme-binding subunit YedZ
MTHLSPSAVTRIKGMVFIACLLPFAAILQGAATSTLGPDPVEGMTHATGLWALRLLLLTLAISPLRKLTGWCWLVRLRRTIALYAFFYATLHTLIYVSFDQAFDWPAIVKDIAKRPWLTAGAVSFFLMIPLAATSTNGMMRRLGRHWQHLHTLIYPAAAGAALHYFWLVKRDVTNPSLYAVLFAALMCARLIERRRRRPPRPATPRQRIMPSA